MSIDWCGELIKCDDDQTFQVIWNVFYWIFFILFKHSIVWTKRREIVSARHQRRISLIDKMCNLYMVEVKKYSNDFCFIMKNYTKKKIDSAVFLYISALLFWWLSTMTTNAPPFVLHFFNAHFVLLLIFFFGCCFVWFGVFFFFILSTYFQFFCVYLRFHCTEKLRTMWFSSLQYMFLWLWASYRWS